MQFNNLEREYANFKPQIDAAVQKVMASGRYLFGENVELLESNFKKLTGKKHAIAVKNATDAITAVLFNINADTVIIPDFGAYPTALAAEKAGVNILFQPVNETFTLDSKNIDDVAAADVVIGVDLFGNECDLKPFRDKKMFIIQDCAQSTGIGNYSDADVNIFSFYPTKPLAAMGDGGMICIDDDQLADKIRRYCFYGLHKDTNNIINAGINSRMDEIQAAIVNVKFSSLNTMNRARTSIASNYLKVLPSGIIPMKATENCVYHQFPVLVEDRNHFIKAMDAKNIPYMIHYPKHVSDMECFDWPDYTVSNPISHKIISLPCNAFMLESEIQKVEEFLINYKY